MAVLLAVTPDAVYAQANRPLVRIVVVDTSGSMAGPRIESAKAEIAAMARQLPPSADRPIILVPFHQTTHSVGTFTDLSALEKQLAGLQADGGTSIAAGLRHAHQELKRHLQSGQVILLLYSDGEDSDQSGIDAAEEELNKLFAVRSKQALPSLVFCKRWDNANGALLTKIAKRGAAQVIDAGKLKVTPVTLKPDIQVTRANWHLMQPLTLEVEGQARLDLAGLPFDAKTPPLQLRCTNPGVSTPPITTRPGDPKTVPFKLTLPIPLDVATSGKTTLQFALDKMAQFTLKDGVALPQAETLSLPLNLPALQLSAKLTATLTATKPPTWADPIDKKPMWHGTVSGTLVAPSSPAWPSPLVLRLHVSRGQLTSTESLVELRAPGKFSLPVTIAGEPLTAGATTFPIAATLKADPQVVTVEPAEVSLQTDSPMPKQVASTLQSQVNKISPARWVDLVHGIAEFEVETTFTVTGPIQPNTKTILLCPLQIKKMAIDPGVLHEGSQAIRLSVQAVVGPAPQTNKLTLQIQQPSDTEAIRFAPPQPLELDVPGPEPLQLALLSPEGGARPEVFVRDRTDPIVLSGTPVLLEIADPQIAAGMSAELRPGALLGGARLQPVALNTALRLPIQMPDLQISFFFDTVIEEDIEIVPHPAVAAVVGSQQRCRVIVEAPFKRLLFLVAVTLAGVAALILVLRILLPRSRRHRGAAVVPTGN